MTQRDSVELSIGVSHIESGRFAGLEIVEDAVIDVFESGANNLREAIAVLADDIDAGFQARGLCLRQ